MNSTSLQQKTIRPGSLGTYNYYHSVRRPLPAVQVKPKRARGESALRRKLALTVFVLAALIGLPLLRPFGGSDSALTAGSSQPNGGSAASVASVITPAAQQDRCGGSHGKSIIVSVSQRHLWACHDGQSQYDAPVITGMLAHPETLTPAGSYRIYAKQKDTVLTGQDSAGAWRDPVSYWMPFLDNQHGTYGFHDATWRSQDEFGQIDPASDKASHGCVELPLASSKWLFEWAPVGTAVNIEN